MKVVGFSRLFGFRQDHADRAADRAPAPGGPAGVGGQACAPCLRHRPARQGLLPPSAAGAFEVVIASRKRLAKMREYELRGRAHARINCWPSSTQCDWALVEGFKHCRPAQDRGLARRQRQAGRSTATTRSSSPSPPTAPAALPHADRRCRCWTSTIRDAIARFLLANAGRFDYHSPLFDDHVSRPRRGRCSAWTKPCSSCSPRRPALTETERVSTFDALGRVLAEDVRSSLDVPPADNSSMDGYALRVADVRGRWHRAAGVRSASPPARSARPLEPGSAARIFTGAPMPAGADAIVMQEQCEAVPGHAWRAGVNARARGRRHGSAAAARTCARAPWCCRAARA